MARVVHYSLQLKNLDLWNPRKGLTVCGEVLPVARSTTQTREATCKRCLNTREFDQAARLEGVRP